MARRRIPFDAEAPLTEPRRPKPKLELPAGDLWIFGYGSLMRDPGFPHAAESPATVYGYHRAFCVWSHHYRGTPARPGLVLGLNPGGACKGRAFRIRVRDRAAVIDYLYRRELLTGIYVPKIVRVRLGRRKAHALAFVVDRSHPQYAGRLPERRIVAIVRKARGRRGANTAYLANTVRHLDQLGIQEGALHRIWRGVQRRGR